ncbi:peptidase M20 domain-containing protein 2-like [Gigantopelta aegis]|uniref:peptidase M20 domain-containing protein 2-like n=1 Tax=Gigantopelta aegis TaxID=1735272 RepID=UPI001B88A33F|nr:peptidase M20 domain-containing protein 2-like [Gigantopelta aegis]
MDNLKSVACKAIDSTKEELKTISKSIFDHPELGYEEHHAHDLLSEFLSSKGFVVDKHYKLHTAFRAVHDGGVGPNLAVLCEYDALPGLGHACGHNLIAEVGVATALGVKAALEKAGKPLGKLTVLGTPAEEGKGGKIDLVGAGAFGGIDCVMMAHPSQCSWTTPDYAAMTELKIKFHGKASHASSAPWDGVNALDAAVQCYQNISCLRQQMKPAWRIHGVITNGGSKPNIIPDVTELLYYVRAPTDPELGQLKQKVVYCVNGAALSTGCKAEFSFDKNEFSSLMSNSVLASLYDEHGKSSGVRSDDEATKRRLGGGSSDIGNVSHVVPSLHPEFFIATASPHTKEFAVFASSESAQEYTLATAKALAMTMVDIFEKPDLLRRIKDEFKLQFEQEKNA